MNNLKTSNVEFIAHPSNKGEDQSLDGHLFDVAELTEKLAGKVGLPKAGYLIGLLHDFGKYSFSFQNYLRSAVGRIDPDSEDYIDPISHKGHIDHSTAGSQYLFHSLASEFKGEGQVVAQALSLCIASHHSGLIDCFKLDGTNHFVKRIKKTDYETHLQECLQNASEIYTQHLKSHLNKDLVVEFLEQLKRVSEEQRHSCISAFNKGFLVRFLFSCLIDADRINSADFETSENADRRFRKPDWKVAIQRLETKLNEFKSSSQKDPVSPIREKISDDCFQRATESQGLYSLTVPTGGGKTYASLRYALHHAKHHGLERIIYIIPYTSIIEQNAQAIRNVIEHEADDLSWVLEHHSNLEPEHQTWHNKIASENWDSPIVLTTMVQFLEVLFAGGTSRARRLHQLANAVLIFDEIQTLPVKTTHLFCNALNFLTDYCGTTALLCTATQPLLNRLKRPDKGQLNLLSENELISDVSQLFEDLKRVEVKNLCKSSGWTEAEISDLAYKQFDVLGSCLVIVNTKDWASKLYQSLQNQVDSKALFILSTNLCPAHRKAIFAEMKQRLNDDLPVLCISTQLIEAGVDVDFASVIRFLAGLDSIAQAAGRCNRNGKRELSTVYVVNPDEEKIDLLHEIKVGRDKARLVLDSGVQDILSPQAMSLYFEHYFYQPDREKLMVFPLKHDPEENILNLLSSNVNIPVSGLNNSDYPFLKQSFMTAADEFEAIDSPTKAVIVPYGEGEAVIAELCRVEKRFDLKAYKKALKQAQQYSVNVFPNVWSRLIDAQAIVEIQGEGIYYLKNEHYSKEFGLSEKVVSTMAFYDC
ncbi:CRISPR-associated helicase Cas3' [Thiomicrorhabdus cannonii]|uniref:CRISPR-associated helicase Cas3' n=1 Tax=Thiomicrorhabdus cannonii TaxID=2748011 RepID=UPI0015BBD9C9|nr:CRISPR-associated helicase Cas3' [Thiomicrorhabdus cannonii]